MQLSNYAYLITSQKKLLAFRRSTAQKGDVRRWIHWRFKSELVFVRRAAFAKPAWPRSQLSFTPSGTLTSEAESNPQWLRFFPNLNRITVGRRPENLVRPHSRIHRTRIITARNARILKVHGQPQDGTVWHGACKRRPRARKVLNRSHNRTSTACIVAMFPIAFASLEVIRKWPKIRSTTAQDGTNMSQSCPRVTLVCPRHKYAGIMATMVCEARLARDFHPSLAQSPQKTQKGTRWAIKEP